MDDTKHARFRHALEITLADADWLRQVLLVSDSRSFLAARLAA